MARPVTFILYRHPNKYIRTSISHNSLCHCNVLSTYLLIPQIQIKRSELLDKDERTLITFHGFVSLCVSYALLMGTTDGYMISRWLFIHCAVRGILQSSKTNRVLINKIKYVALGVWSFFWWRQADCTYSSVSIDIP